MPVDAPIAERVRLRLAQSRVDPGARVVVMHVSAGNPFRRWPVDSFADVAAALASLDADIRVIVTSGPSEAEAAARVIETARERLPHPLGERVLACGEFSLAELRALVDVAALYIGGDSGPMHIAATSRVPMVSLYGPTLPARSQPWRSSAIPSISIEVAGLGCRPCDQRVCEPGDFRCLSLITPQQVIEAATRLLRRNG
jgi:ADP-heptose:LPS heptosyltransferase